MKHFKQILKLECDFIHIFSKQFITISVCYEIYIQVCETPESNISRQNPKVEDHLGMGGFE